MGSTAIIGAVLGALTVTQWVQLALALPKLIDMGEKVVADIHPAITLLQDVFSAHKSEGCTDQEAALSAGTAVYADRDDWMSHGSDVVGAG